MWSFRGRNCFDEYRVLASLCWKMSKATPAYGAGLWGERGALGSRIFVGAKLTLFILGGGLI